MILKVSAGFVLSIILLVSCSSNTGDGDLTDSTLKSTALSLDSRTQWTQAIEENDLSEDYSEVKGISSKVELSSEVLPLSQDFISKEKVYPEIKDSWHLENSKMEEKCFTLIDGFLTALENGESAESYFDAGGIYSLVIFKYDFSRLLGNTKVYWHAIGEGFFDDGYVQCPVRFFFDEKKDYNGSHADAMIIAKRTDYDWKIISVDLISQAGEENAE